MTVLSLTDSELHLWRIDLTRDAPQVTLSPDEMQRAERLKLSVKREQFIRSRAWMRYLLSLYVGAAPSALRFLYGEYGKPALELESLPSLQFNLAHCETRAVLVVMRDVPVGVDIERVRPTLSFDAMMQMSFTLVERVNVLSQPDPCLAFYRVWTRKEAVVKCVGSGFRDVSRFCVSADVFPLVLDNSDILFSGLSLHEVNWGDFIVTTAVKRKIIEIKVRDASEFNLEL